MLKAPKPEHRWRDWTWVVAWALVIYASIPVARRLQEMVAERWGRNVFQVAVIAVIVVGALATVVMLRRSLGWGGTVWVAVVAGTYVFLSFYLCDVPEESLHFVEYGVLGILTFRAFSHRHRNWLVYLCAALLCVIIGTFDEIIQWLAPGRYFDFRDVRLNGLSGALMQVAIALGLRPPYVQGPVRVESVRRVCRLAAAQLLLLGLCYLNTPERVMWYAERIPALSHLRYNESVMSEFGYRIEDPDIGVFRSRMPPGELVQQDRERAEEAARALNKYFDRHEARDPANYRAFLKVYTPGTDPFLHELRVHIRSRDANIRMARSKAPGSDLYRERMTRAFREHQILEKYFGHSVAASPYRFTPDQTAELKALHDPDMTFTSLVSQNLITDVPERRIWVTVGAGLLVLGLVARFSSNVWKPTSEELPTPGR